MTDIKLTAPQERMLRILDGYPMGSSRELAKRMWPDSPGWTKRSRRHDGKAGAVGATMPMKAATLLWKLRSMGLAERQGELWVTSIRGANMVRPGNWAAGV